MKFVDGFKGLRNFNILSISAYATSLLLGLIIGGVACYLLLNRSKLTEATMQITSSDPKAIVSNESLEVKSTQRLVKAVALFETDRGGTYTNTITINRRNLQFKHSIYGETGYWINSQMPFIGLSYSYNWLLISAKVGYSFRLQKIDYGIGLGMKYSF